MQRGFLNSRHTVWVLLVVFILVLIACGRESYRYFRINREISGLKNKIEEFKKNNEELSKIKEYFQSDEFLEKEARIKLNFVKEGEKVIIIASGEEELDDIQESLEKKIPNTQLWWEYFFGKRI